MRNHRIHPIMAQAAAAAGVGLQATVVARLTTASIGTIALLLIILRTIDVVQGLVKSYSLTEEIETEYRRLKRQKLRKLLRNCIWNCTPSPPRDPNQSSDLEPEDEITRKVEEEKEGREDNKLKSGSKKLSSYSSESESESKPEDFESRSDDSLPRKKRKSRKLSSRHEGKVKGLGKRASSLKSQSRKKKKESENESSNADESNSDSEINEKNAKQKVDEAKVSNENNAELLKFKEMIESRKKLTLDNEPVIRPMPLPRAEGHVSYTGELMTGEGDAIAQYVQQGKRIPRRREVGLLAEEIYKFETIGYVMSGSRHQRMNAIRIRKRKPSAEDKRALAMFNYEEKKVMADLQRLVQRHIGQDSGASHDPFAGRAVRVMMLDSWSCLFCLFMSFFSLFWMM
ncbi:Hypothetical predicted protein [Olea europaea subsp. europaea]|uniref:NF-kappa-B-activating protein C-terminal domain-containing protein n=1 Tax=Olea europaea subsp. europaea TaxID=158383 RepID=A0A8S0S6V9_OLEEU|nr:Hypothetical predicted protein [Olea europaea subsp. europaea]